MGGRQITHILPLDRRFFGCYSVNKCKEVIHSAKDLTEVQRYAKLGIDK